jgi:uncharacterized membrane protein YecN with MAPEG domain
MILAPRNIQKIAPGRGWSLPRLCRDPDRAVLRADAKDPPAMTPPPMITGLYAALLGLLLLALSAQVVRLRMRYRVALGTGQHRLVERAVRAHGNFTEYAPLALLLLALLEMNLLPGWALHALGVALLAARALHAWGLSQEPEVLRWRSVGTGLTFAVLLVQSAALLGLVLAGLLETGLPGG